MRPPERDLTSNRRGMFSAFVRASGGDVAEVAGVTCIRSPTPFLLFHMAFVEDPSAFEPTAARQIQDFYRESRTEWCFAVPARFDDHLRALMDHVPVSARESTAEMLVARGSFAPPEVPPELEVRRVQDVDQFLTWSRVCSVGFGQRDLRFFDALANPQGLTPPQVAYYLGIVNGRAVATSAAYVSDGIAGVYAVCTLPEARGRGYGAALAGAAAEDGFSRGCGISSLQATPKGFPVYVRMGYRHAFDYLDWIVSPRRPGGRRA